MNVKDVIDLLACGECDLDEAVMGYLGETTKVPMSVQMLAGVGREVAQGAKVAAGGAALGAAGFMLRERKRRRNAPAGSPQQSYARAALQGAAFGAPSAYAAHSTAQYADLAGDGVFYGGKQAARGARALYGLARGRKMVDHL